MIDQKFIFFGHQSVGKNIIDALSIAGVASPIPDLKIIELNNVESLETPAFYHGRIGENLNPSSKNAAFSDILRRGTGEKIDIAFFKYCYVDIHATTNIHGLLADYRITMNRLQRQFEAIRFVHVTVPLTVVQTGPRALVKKLINREIGGYGDNIKRNEFNDLLRLAYDGREPIFDLAAIESTYPNGTRAAFSQHGRTYYAMVPEYASDGRHLNEHGAAIVAEQLLKLLANLSH